MDDSSTDTENENIVNVLTISDVIQRYDLQCTAVHTSSKIPVTGIDLDSRTVQKGHIFAALQGVTHHGAHYADEAAKGGALAVLTDEYGQQVCHSKDINIPVLYHRDIGKILGNISADIYGNPTDLLGLIGITGTSGKTTTSYLTRAALSDPEYIGLLGTIEISIGDRHIPSTLTTPQAPRLQYTLQQMHLYGAHHVVMEVSSHALSQYRVRGSVFSVAGFTNLSHDHLDYHSNMEEYFTVKSQLFVDPSYGNPIPVINIDDQWGQRLAAQLRDDHRLMTVSSHLSRPGDWTIGRSMVVKDKQRFIFSAPDGKDYKATISLPGRYNTVNAVVAIAIAYASGISISDAIESIKFIKVPGRLEAVDEGQAFLALVDYAHKPAALASVLSTLRQAADTGHGRLAIVFGAGGDRDRKKRPIMGQIAAEYADLVIVTDDNPRSEKPGIIRTAIEKGARSVASNAQIRVIGSRSEAITQACLWAKAGDIVLIAGKGHEKGQEINGVKHPFDDRYELVRAIRERPREYQ